MSVTIKIIVTAGNAALDVGNGAIDTSGKSVMVISVTLSAGGAASKAMLASGGAGEKASTSGDIPNAVISIGLSGISLNGAGNKASAFAAISIEGSASKAGSVIGSGNLANMSASNASMVAVDPGGKAIVVGNGNLAINSVGIVPINAVIIIGIVGGSAVNIGFGGSGNLGPS